MSNKSIFDEYGLEKEINPELIDIYNKLKTSAIKDLKENNKDKVYLFDHSWINGIKLTCAYYLRKEDGKINEQFEYYHYRYWHNKYINL